MAGREGEEGSARASERARRAGWLSQPASQSGEWSSLKMAGAAVAAAATTATSATPVYCVCREPYDVSRFMIECDICKDWFHGR